MQLSLQHDFVCPDAWKAKRNVKLIGKKMCLMKNVCVFDVIAALVLGRKDIFV